MFDSGERSIYPKPSNFGAMQPEYEDIEDGTIQATTGLTPFWTTGASSTRPGLLRTALYWAHMTYNSYHPFYVMPSPFWIRSQNREM